MSWESSVSRTTTTDRPRKERYATRLIDETGAPGHSGDVAIRDGKVAAVGEVTMENDEVIGVFPSQLIREAQS